ncbi:hypothetical protein [Actinoplanes sp. NPDC051859]|uniref:hypothetical protein n=1 Tax=Actinoplanes sp. NPDC051859 TaxID=3363909 RepID=UPI003798AE4E
MARNSLEPVGTSGTAEPSRDRASVAPFPALSSIVDDTLAAGHHVGGADFRMAASVVQARHLHQNTLAPAGRADAIPCSPTGPRSLLHSSGIATGPERNPGPDALRSRPATLPLVDLRAPNTGVGRYCAVTPIDDRRRLADRNPLRILGWGPGTPVTVSAEPQAGIIAVSLGGDETVDRQGRLRLIAEVRHGCRLATGDRLFVVAYPAEAVLVIYLWSAVSAMTSAYHGILTDQVQQ